jgi:hypothetical protein
LWALPTVVGTVNGTVVVVVLVDTPGADDPSTVAPGVGSKSIQP